MKKSASYKDRQQFLRRIIKRNKEWAAKEKAELHLAVQQREPVQSDPAPRKAANGIELATFGLALVQLILTTIHSYWPNWHF